MPRLLSAALIHEKNKLESDHVFTMAFEVTIPGSPGALRLVNHDQDITFHGFTFLRFPVSVDMLEEASSAALVHLRINATNVDQQIQSLLENYWRDSPDWTCVIWQLDAMQPDEVPYTSGELFSIASVSTDLMTATFDVVAEGLTLTTLVPKRKYTTAGGFPFLVRRD